ncbi:MAG: hypothetical protein AAFX06_02035 [Planctomycetota bacterium]
MAPSSIYVVSSLFSLLLTVIAFIAAIIVTTRNQWRSRQAARLVWLALGLKLFAYVGGWGTMILVSRVASPTSYGIVTVISQAIQGVLGAIVLLLFVRAAFVDRDSSPNPAEAELTGGVPAGDQNPYAAPR